MTAPAPYVPRPVRALGLWQAGPLRLKAYHIGAEAPSEAALTAARHETVRAEAAAEEEGGSSGLGFVVMHAGEMGTWLLMDWWAHGDILCQRLSLALAGGAYEPMDDRPLTACVWELPFLMHERDAYVRHMMTARPDAGAYLADMRPGGVV